MIPWLEFPLFWFIGCISIKPYIMEEGYFSSDKAIECVMAYSHIKICAWTFQFGLFQLARWFRFLYSINVYCFIASYEVSPLSLACRFCLQLNKFSFRSLLLLAWRTVPALTKAVVDVWNCSLGNQLYLTNRNCSQI